MSNIFLLLCFNYFFPSFGVVSESSGTFCHQDNDAVSDLDRTSTICRKSNGDIYDVICGKGGKCGKELAGDTQKSGGESSNDGISSNSDSGSCFPASATVELESGATIEMRSLKIGDSVRVSLGDFSDVYMFTHKLLSGNYDFIEITTASGHALRATQGHYLYANDVLVPASQVSVGDRMRLGDGSESPVLSVATVGDEGIFAPQTVDGDILVNGVLSSTYTTFVPPRLAHRLLAPMRALYKCTGIHSSLLDMGMPTFGKARAG